MYKSPLGIGRGGRRVPRVARFALTLGFVINPYGILLLRRFSIISSELLRTTQTPQITRPRRIIFHVNTTGFAAAVHRFIIQFLNPAMHGDAYRLPFLFRHENRGHVLHEPGIPKRRRNCR
jgi:hypothetical protein